MDTSPDVKKEARVSEMTAEAAKSAKDAVRHVLNAIADDPRKYWLMGPMSGSYEKLTKAASEIWSQPVEKIQSDFQPRKEQWEAYLAEKEEQEKILEFCQENGITSQNIKERLRS